MQTEVEQIKAEYAKLGERIAELEKQAEKQKEKRYSWEECFSGNGFYLERDSKIYEAEGIASETSRNIATTEKVCKSHLAACQLSHIIERLNEDFGGDEKIIIYYDAINKKVKDLSGLSWALPYLKSHKASDKLIETNTPLLKQYFGIDEKE